MTEREDITPGESEAPDSGFEEDREEYVREHPDDPESGGAGEEPAPSVTPAEPEAPDSGFEEDRDRYVRGHPDDQESGAPDDDAAASALEHDIGELQEKARERDEYLALAQRAQADFDNYRKRVARDLTAAEGRGLAKLARELLPALDSLGLALGSGQLDAEGLRLIQSEFVAALGRVGIEAFSPEGEPFDPNQHEAMAKQPVEGAAPGTVADVYQQGYRINGSVLRPARVVVAE